MVFDENDLRISADIHGAGRALSQHFVIYAAYVKVYPSYEESLEMRE